MSNIQYDFVIRNARVVDGTGAPWFRADVGLLGPRIARIGTIPAGAGAREIDAEERFLTPGFVDSHIHTDLKLLEDRDFAAGVYQGVTSHIIGQDGISYAPATPERQAETRQYFAGVNGDPQLSCSWQSVAEYLACFDGTTSQNVAYLLPQGSIRLQVMGQKPGKANAKELAQMQALVRQGMLDGAVGISTGLDYVPCCYADTEELAEVTKPAGELGGIYVAHIRSYGAKLEEAMEETATIGRLARCPVHVSHYNGKAPRLGPLVDHWRAEGVDLTFDTYPYLAGCSILSMVALPRWMEEGGAEPTLARLADPAVREKLKEVFAAPAYALDAIQLASIDAEEDKELEGLRLPAAAEKRCCSIADLVCDLLLRSRLRVGCVVFHTSRSEEDVIGLMQHPAHVAGSDGIYNGSRPHPRGFGTFARYLEYVRDRQVLPLEEMVRHLASHPARRFSLAGRGLIREGFFADLNLFDLQNIKATATYEKPALAEGMDWVFVNGRPVLADGQATGERPGVGIRGPAASKAD